MIKKILMAFSAVTGCLILILSTAQAGSPTCSDTLGVATHGQHIVGDYVIGGRGIGGNIWPFNKGAVGAAIARIGAAIPGGPGPAFHFINGFAPGASFCTSSSAPGVHL
jgi:hypothetical protein